MAPCAPRSAPVPRPHAIARTSVLSAVIQDKRTLLAALVATSLLALSWWRSPVSYRPSADFSVTPVAIPEPEASSLLRVTGIWDIDGSGAGFGGFSALLAMPGDQLRSFSDRGWRFTFAMSSKGPTDFVTGQVVPAKGYSSRLFDIESATPAPGGDAYWLSYEATHAVHRFAADNTPELVRDLSEDMDWPANSGIEAMVRLANGRFVVFPEAGTVGLVFAGDPTDGAGIEPFQVDWPEADFRPTDAAQLPDGRVLVLLRRFSMTPLPTFESLLVSGDIPQPEVVWQPEVFARLGQLLPPENYEGLAIRPRTDGSSELWLISDDNFSAFQRTLLVRMIYVQEK